MPRAKTSDWRAAYQDASPRYERLSAEVLYALESMMAASSVRTHSVTTRVKSLRSLAKKSSERNWSDPLAEAGDIVGARVVVLFLTDLPEVSRQIEALFEIDAIQDFVEGPDPATFGYMSRHMDARLGSRHSGARYEGLQDLGFEIQIRTILMDAWANVSHHLAYKTESNIPEELRRDFHALSGLFYVADRHFELFYSESKRVELAAAARLSDRSPEAVQLSLESLAAFLRQRYPERKTFGRDSVAELLTELQRFGYRDLMQLAQDLDRSAEAFARSEVESPPSDGGRFADVGVVRTSIAILNSDYRTFLRREKRRPPS